GHGKTTRADPGGGHDSARCNLPPRLAPPAGDADVRHPAAPRQGGARGQAEVAMGPTELAARLSRRFTEVLEARGEVTVTVVPEEMLVALAYLKDEPDLAFGFLSDVTCTDWPGLDPRWWLAYHIVSMLHRHRVHLKAG